MINPFIVFYGFTILLASIPIFKRIDDYHDRHWRRYTAVGRLCMFYMSLVIASVWPILLFGYSFIKLTDIIYQMKVEMRTLD